MPQPDGHPGPYWGVERAPARPRSRVLATALTIAFVALIAFGGGIVVGHAIPNGNAAQAQQLKGFDLYYEALSDIQKNFVNRSQIDDKTLVYGSIRGMVDALGDTGHSRFLTPEEYAAEQQSLSGELTGIGIVGGEVNGVPAVVKVIPGSPAEAAGLKPGDEILGVDGQSTTGLSFDDVVSKIRGPAGSKVTLTILHQGSTDPVEVTVTRAVIKIPLVAWGMIPGTHVADISLLEFDRGAADQLGAAVTAATKAGATSIVFDLRGNPGGYVDEAVNTASEFIASGNVFIQVFADGHQEAQAINKDQKRTNLPMMVLVDSNSASAAEIVSGALQDAGRAKVVGVRTFGTGTVLQPFKLSDGSALYLGTSKFLTRNGHEIFGKGINPDKVVALPVGASPLDPSLLASMSASQFAASKDDQLSAAVQLLQ